MSARSHHNVKRTMPAGRDFEDVLKRAKRFFRITEKFRILPPFYENGIYIAVYYSDTAYSKGQRVFEFVDGRWTEVKEGFWNKKEA